MVRATLRGLAARRLRFALSVLAIVLIRAAPAFQGDTGGFVSRAQVPVDAVGVA